MATKTALFNMRIDPEVKEAAEKLFAQYGLGLSDAVNIFLHQALYEQALPFELKRRQPQSNDVAADSN